MQTTMSSLVETIGYVFGLVALGYLTGWFGLLRKDAGEVITSFAVTIAVPLLLFRTMSNAQFGEGLPWGLWITYFTAIAITWTVSQLSLVHIFKRDGRAGVVAGLAGSFSNLVLLGIPFMLGVHGQEAFEQLSLIVTIHLPIMTGVSILLYNLHDPQQQGSFSILSVLKGLAQRMLTNPLIIGILGGLIWRAGGLELPSLAERLIDSLANVAGPVALFAMGLGLRSYGIKGDVRPAILIAFYKQMLMPAIALGLAVALDLSPITAIAVVTAASFPCGVNPYLIASQFGTGQRLASNAMTIGTALAFLSTAFWIAVTASVFS
jgi:predicted permease